MNNKFYYCIDLKEFRLSLKRKVENTSQATFFNSGIWFDKKERKKEKVRYD